MKKIALLLTGLFVGGIANAQLTLSGTSYTQNFNGIGSGLPTGWYVYTNAEAGSLGNDVTGTKYVSTTTRWNWTSGNFRNVASANSFPASVDTTTQNAATDRALGVRQVGYTSTSFPGTDSGAAFVLQLANTNGLTNFQASFKLQSLDTSSPRTTTWKVDYGFGATPTTFTTATITGTNTTGNKTYSNNTINVNFGSALDNQAGPIWIRIVTLNMSTGSGNRPTSAIDDFMMTWSNSSPNPSIASMTPANNATNVPANTNLTITFDKAVTKGTGNIVVKNETDQTMSTIAVSSSNVTINNKVVTVTSLNLLNSKTYHVTIDANAFDSAGFFFAGISDTTMWKFTTGPNSVASINGANNIPVTVAGIATNNSIRVNFTAARAGAIRAAIYDLNGRQVYRKETVAVTGDNTITLTPASLAGGLYIIRIEDAKNFGTAKAFVE